MSSATAAFLAAHLVLACAVSPLLGQASSPQTRQARPSAGDTSTAQRLARQQDTATRAESATAGSAVARDSAVTAEQPRGSGNLLVYIAATFLGLMALLMTAGFFLSMQNGGSLAVESNWGGFGGGGGGWRLSRSLSYLIGLMFSAGLLTALALREDSRQQPSSAASSQTRPPASTSISSEDTASSEDTTTGDSAATAAATRGDAP